MHDRKNVRSGKSVQSGAHAPQPQPNPSRPSLESSSQNPPKLGTGRGLASGGDTSTSLADSVPAKPQFFNFDAQAVRVVGSWQSPRFVAKDVCDVLAIQNHRDTLAKVLEDDEKGVDTIYTLGGPQELLTVTESGLYALIFRSRKPSAKLFRRWVTGEVLPAIRKTGGYGIVRDVHLIHRRELPPAPSVDRAVGTVLAYAIGTGFRSTFATPRDLARAARDAGEFASLSTDPDDPRHVARLRTFLAPYVGKWVPSEGGSQSFWYCLTATSVAPHRRYFVRYKHQQEMPVAISQTEVAS